MEPTNATECMESIGYVYNTTLKLCLAFVPFVVHFNRVAMPVWLIIGVPGSVLSLLVWSSRPMRSSSSIYLCALAILDLVFLLCQQLPYQIQNFYDINALYNPVMCQASPVYNMWLQYLSPLLTLGFTIERYISICHPFSRDRLCTVRRAVAVVTCMTVACLALGLVQLQFYKYSFDYQTCSEDMRIFDQTTIEHRFYSGWTKMTEVLFFALAPLAILAFNILVLLQARKVIKKQASTGQQDQAAKSAATTATLLTVSFYQIGAVLPVTVLLFVGLAILTEDPQLPCGITKAEALQQLARGQWPVVRAYLAYVTISQIVNCLSVSHYAMKLVIYLVTGRKFRLQLTLLLRGGGCGGGGAGTENGGDWPERLTAEQRRARRYERRLQRSDSDCSSVAVELMGQPDQQ